MLATRYAAVIATLFWAVHLPAQTEPGILRGFVLSTAERFLVQSNGNQFVFRRDCLTWVQRGEERIAFTDLRPNEHIEIICDRDGPVPHYARVVHVILPANRPEHPARAYLSPRTDLVYAGVVVQLQGQTLQLRTRREGLQTIYLRPDTSYLEEGSRVSPANLQPQTRIFVKAARNLDNDLEAHQIIWGRILEPHILENFQK